VEFRDLKRQYKVLKKDIDKQIEEVINSSCFILGDKVKEIENRLSLYTGRKYCISVASGTDALELSLMVLNIKENDAVFVSDFSYIASASIIRRVGGYPIFVDIDKNTFNISYVDLKKKIEDVIQEGKLKPKAIITVDLFGQCADYIEIEKVAKEYDLKIIEDAAQGFGSCINNKKACSFGDISCTSFFPSKPLGCYGDGGAIFTDDENIKNRLLSLRSNGRSLNDKYDNIEIGTNSRLDAIQAGILLAKLTVFDDELIDINNSADKYTKRLKSYVTTPTVLEDYKSCWAQYTILLKDKNQRDLVINELNKNDIPSIIYYPKGLHRQKCFKDLNIDDNKYPITNDISDRCLSLPIYPYMKDEEIDLVCNIIIKVIL